MSEETTIDERKNAGAACMRNARAFLDASKKVLDDSPSIAYHLAIVALEEIGKSVMLTISLIQSGTQNDREEYWRKSSQRHIRKLEWALFSAQIGNSRIDPDFYKSIVELAERLHANRLRAMYVEFDKDEQIFEPSELIEREAAEKLIGLVEARFQLQSAGELSQEGIDRARWLIKASERPEEASFIFSKESLERLSETGTADWANWLKEQLQARADLNRQLAEEELQRETNEDEVYDPKWKIKVRFHSESHSIRQRVLNWWNALDTHIQLFSIDDKRMKNQILVEFTLPKSISVDILWPAGFGYGQRFLTALNIGSRGYFWWTPRENLSRYYESLRDLERNSDLKVERSPHLKVNWGQLALSEHDLRLTALCYRHLPSYSAEDREVMPFSAYLTGIAYFAKTDIHVQFEADAARCFQEALYGFMQLFGDWDGKSESLKESIRTALAKLPLTNVDDVVNRFSSQLDKPNLGDVGGLKVICDAYVLREYESRALREQESDQE